MTTTKNNLDPRTWSKRNKIIAAIAASVAVILAIAGISIAVFGSQSHNAKDCTSYQQILTDKTAELDQAIQDAKDALKTVDASLKPGEGTRLAHTDGFPLSSEGQSAINDLSKAISAAKSAKEAEDAKATDAAADNNSKKSKCSGEPDTTSVDAAIKAIKDQTQSFVSMRDAYRLTKATDEANELMDTAKSNLASAQQSAAEQIAAVEADPNMESDASVKAAYDALKAVETESHTLSTTVTVTTYDEAVASIEKAKTVEQKAAEVTASVAPLQEAITTYQDAKAGSASNASTAPEQGSNNSNAPAPSYGYNGNGGSSNSGSNGSSYSGGSSYTPPAPAPAPAPAPPASNSGSGDGRIDFGPGQADRPGCVIIEGRSVC